MKHILPGLLIICSIGLTGCLVAPVVPPIGFAFTDIQAPLDIDYDPTVVDGEVGISESISILGLIAIGDASAKTAAHDARITTIEHADYEYFNVLGVFQRYRTVVSGK